MVSFTKHFSLLVVIASLTIIFSGAGSDVDSNYTLSCSKIFGVDEKPSVQIESYNFAGSIHFRAFKVEDPVGFFEQQRDVHSPDIASLRSTSVFKILGAAIDKISRDAREAARSVMPEHARNVMIGIADIQRTKDEKGISKDSVISKVPKELENYPIVKEWNEQVVQDKNGWIYKNIPVGITTPGVYLLEGRSTSKVAYTVVVISKYGVVTKRSDTKLVAFVVDRQTGKSIDAFPLNIYLDKKKIGSGKTDNGLFSSAIPQEKNPEPTEETFESESNSGLIVMGYQENQFVIMDPYYYPYNRSYSRYNVLTYTERPIYRPGQEVYFKTIIRENSIDEGLLNYARKPLKISVTDSRGNVIFRDSSWTNDNGTYNNHFTLGEEPPLGFYSIRALVDDAEYYSDFQVEEYKKPEYKVEVKTDKPQYAKGEVINATIKADYFFGSPVANAEVEYFIYRSRYWRPWWRGTDFEWYYEEENQEFYSYRQEMTESNTGKLDDNGELTLTIYSDANATEDYIYRIQANVVDQSRRSITGAKSVEVTRGLFSVTLRSGKWVYKPNDKIDVTVSTIDFKNNPVSAPFIVSVQRVWWDRFEIIKEGAKHYTYKKHEANITQFSGQTKNSGTEGVNFSVNENGYYNIVVTATDVRGNKISESTSVYVSDESYYAWWGDESSEKITIIPDKASYVPGETMHALVTMPASDIDAIVSVECGDMYEVQQMHFDGASKMIDVEMKDEFVPNVYLSVSTMFEGELLFQSKRILALPQNKFLNVQIVNNKQVYRPGERGTVQVKVTDSKGSPVKNAEVSLSVVDEAVYAIAPESTPDMKRKFYALRHNEVDTQASEYFNFYGYSRSLRREEMALEEFGNMRNTLTASRADQEKKIAYGDVKGEMFIEPVVRRDFRDMIHWSPSIMTDGNGSAKIQMKYPDNLTTWRATVRVVNKETQVGSSISKVIARKNLLVRMETPRFFMQNDICAIATVVHNYLPSDKKVKIQFTASNAAVEGKEQTITVPRNGQMRIDWKIQCPKSGNSKLLVKAMTNEESDAMELTLPILTRGIHVADSRIMDTEQRNDSRTASFEIPDGTDLSSAELFINVSPSLASSILSALDELIGYPYGCVEQTMSRFLPTIIVAHALEKLGAPMPEEKKKEIPKMISSGLKRLYNMQHNDGGWGWWINDESDPFMTAYVLYGMTIAKEIGYDVSGDAFERGVKRLTGMLDTKDLDPTAKAYIMYVLSMTSKLITTSNQSGLSSIVKVYNPKDPNNYALALLALANHNFGNQNEARAYVNQLERTKKFQDQLTYWAGKSWHYDWQNDNVETTALVLKALLNIRGDGRDVKDGIRWLVSQRKGFAWESTRQTAMTLFTLVDYMKMSKEMQPDYSITVYVNDQKVWQKKITKADIFIANQRIKVDAKYLQPGRNAIRYEKNGHGSNYFTARLMYFSPEKPIAQHSAGFSVKREYYLLQKQRFGSEIMYVKQPIPPSVKSGDEIFVKVTVLSTDAFEYFMLEDPIPSGCEVISLTNNYKIKSEKGYEGTNYYGWRWWWADRDVRDEKVSFFTRDFDSGKYEFSYIMRAQIPGIYSIMPTVASLMYYPEVRGNSTESSLVIR